MRKLILGLAIPVALVWVVVWSLTAWLNARAIRNDIPLPAGKARHYEVKDAAALFTAGVAFVRSYW